MEIGNPTDGSFGPARSLPTSGKVSNPVQVHHSPDASALGTVAFSHRDIWAAQRQSHTYTHTHIYIHTGRTRTQAHTQKNTQEIAGLTLF